MGTRGPSKGEGGRPAIEDRTTVRRAGGEGGRVLSTKLSAVEGELFDRLLAAVGAEDRATGGAGKLSPSAMVRRLILEAAQRRGV